MTDDFLASNRFTRMGREEYQNASGLIGKLDWELISAQFSGVSFEREIPEPKCSMSMGRARQMLTLCSSKGFPDFTRIISWHFCKSEKNHDEIIRSTLKPGRFLTV